MGRHQRDDTPGRRGGRVRPAGRTGARRVPVGPEVRRAARGAGLSPDPVRALLRAVGARHLPTREHSERVAGLSVRVALTMGWTAEAAVALRDAGALHDIGKIGVPDSVLLKPGALTASEYASILRHPRLGAEIASPVLDADQLDWVLHHHERWDGSGYPDGLETGDISEGAAILALVDAYDAMTSARPYRATLPPALALEECRREAGRQFEPAAVDALVDLVRGDRGLAVDRPGLSVGS